MTEIKADSSIQTINWKITGVAGEGVMLSSKLVGKAFIRHGWASFTYFEYPSLIKGGHQTGQVLARPTTALNQKKTLDILLVLDKTGWQNHLDEIDEHTVLIFNQDAGQIAIEDQAKIKSKIQNLAMLTLAQQASGRPNNMNIVAFGVSSKLLGLNQTICQQVLKDEFADKDVKILEPILKAFDAGYQAITTVVTPITPVARKQLMLTGNEAVGFGALAGGVQFYSAYPMTPATGVMIFLAEQQQKYPLIVKHAEDEIGAISHAIGASYAGVRAMTGSSGGGLALMSENVSLASITETPLVILAASRVGPATGLPTWTAQADLDFIIGLGHGETQKIILTPGTVSEHYQLTKQAFDLAEKYQLPVFVLSDKHALESYHTLEITEPITQISKLNMAENLPEDNSFLRYQLTESGVSPRSIPGQNHGLHLANSYEHDLWGYATEEADMTAKQAEKREKKLTTLAAELPQPKLLGPQQAEISIICWGSTVLALQDTLADLNQGGINKVNVIHFPCVWPFPTKGFTQLVSNAKKLAIIEGNMTGQLQQLIMRKTGIKIDHQYRRYDGRPFYSEDIIAWINQL